MEAADATTPMTRPARTSTSPARRFDRVPTALVETLTNRLVPFATRSLTANKEIISGTAMMPPPIPNSPEDRPIAMPIPMYPRRH
jgi:hypothetical protein